jgi:hypothetical protein
MEGKDTFTQAEAAAIHTALGTLRRAELCASWFGA